MLIVRVHQALVLGFILVLGLVGYRLEPWPFATWSMYTRSPWVKPMASINRLELVAHLPDGRTRRFRSTDLLTADRDTAVEVRGRAAFRAEFGTAHDQARRWLVDLVDHALGEPVAVLEGWRLTWVLAEGQVRLDRERPDERVPLGRFEAASWRSRP